MRYLVLLRGSAGCGKTTWLEKTGLKPYSISADDIRTMLRSPSTNIEGKLEISQLSNKKVWNMIFETLEERMSRGELTIIDATHSTLDMISKYRNLCQEYRYRCVVVEFPNDVETILKQNASREEIKRVPEDSIRNMCSRIETQPTPNWCTKTTPDKFLEEYGSIKVFDFNNYEEIVHFGDIHGCYEPLKEYFEKHPFSENKFYIFTGDYTDRGIQNKEVIEFLFTLIDKKNVLFLEGNHEIHTKLYANDKEDQIKSSEFKKFTLSQIESIDKKQLRIFYGKLAQLALYEYGNEIFFVCHGGCPLLPTYFTSTEELVKGVGKYEDYLKVEESWNKWAYKQNTVYYQIHAHRNTENNDTENGRCYNLCDRVEFGGNLRILTLSKDGDNVKKNIELIKNNVYYINNNVAEEKIVIDGDNLISKMMNSKLVQVKSLKNNVISLNFTRDAFHKKEWNDLTIQARGLFINKNTKEVVARSYDKFFAVDENESMKTNVLRRKMVFPAKAYIKYNGYLGITGYNSEADELFIATKTTDTGDMREKFKSILENTLDINKLSTLCKENNMSIIFEVIDPVNDPHIIEYDKEQVILLDCIYRDLNFSKSDKSEEIAKELGVKYKELAYTFNDYLEFENFIANVKKENLNMNLRSIEGFVIEDSNGYMMKLKNKYYTFWKFMRGFKDQIALGRVVNLHMLNKPLDNKVYAFMKNKGREYCAEHSIIEIRKDFEKEYGNDYFL
jgi:predicted kinase